MGLLLLAVNVACACWDISDGTYWALPINAVGVIASLFVLAEEF